MKNLAKTRILTGLLLVAGLAYSHVASAQREVHWQVNPNGFPDQVSVFVDIEENGVFKRDLNSGAFSVSLDKYAGDYGGWVLNQQQVVSGNAGAQILIIVDAQDELRDLERLRKNQYGKDSVTIGEIKEGSPRVKLKTVIGSTRVVDMLTGEQIPRIC